jgi:alanyl-tRNA synthetase
MSDATLDDGPRPALPAYLRDSYLQALDTEVLAVGDAEGRLWAELADTVLYPEGGGQPADRGRIGTTAVVDVQKVGDRARHFVAGPVAPGPAHLELDWPRRWDHMQQHTAQHLLTALALRELGWPTTAFHLGPELSDIELATPSIGDAERSRLEEICALEIRAGRPVEAAWIDPGELERHGVRSRRLPAGHAGAVRVVEISGLDRNTCGGTHLRSTAEIGVLCLLGTEPMRGGTRLFFVAGDRARMRLAAHEARNLRLRTLLGAADDELAAVVALRLDKEKELNRVVRQLGEELAAAAAAELAARAGTVVDSHWPARDMAFLQQVGRRLAETAPAKVALLTAGDGAPIVFAVVAGEAAGIDLASLGPRVAAALGGRGGGRSPVYQGKTESLAGRPAALALLEEAAKPAEI